MRFIHLSDLHLHRGAGDNAEAKKVLDFVHAKYPDDHVIVTGDVTDDGSAEQYENAMELLARFNRGPRRIFICPGNHDFGAVGNFYSEERAERFDELLAGPLQQGGTFKGYNLPVVNVVKDGDDSAMIIALDSNLETDHPFDFACGEVGEGQLKGLDRILSTPTVPEMKKILILHHHPFIVNNPFMELFDARALMRVIFDRIDVLMFGHKHESKMWTEKEMKGIKFTLAADNAPGKDWARRVTIENGAVKVKDVAISQAAMKKK
ncbi:MAG TPA: metallophosphoesterase [bacterium]|nr:metallophosphoesterase [bacterium]